MRGTIRRWGTKGYGFIESPDLPVTAWCHLKHLADDYRFPRVGDEVEFEPVEVGAGRFQAHEVRLAPADAAGPADAPTPAPPEAVPRPSEDHVEPTGPAEAPQGASSDAGGRASPTPVTLAGVVQLLDTELEAEREAAAGVERTERSTVEAAEVSVAQALRALRIAERARDEARRNLDEAHARCSTLPAEQATRRAKAIEEFIGAVRRTFRGRIDDRRRRLKETEAARCAAVSRLGEPAVRKYEDVRGRARKGPDDAVAREAFQMLESRERERLSDYADALDRLESAGDTPFPVLLARAGGAGDGALVVSPLPSGTGANGDWRLAATFWDAIERASRELGTDPGPIEAGDVAGSAAARIRASDLEDCLALVLDEAISSRHSLQALGLVPHVESAPHLTLPLAPSPDQGAKAARSVTPEGGSLADVAGRFGVPLRILVGMLKDHDLPAPDDRIDAGTEGTLARLLGIAIAPPRGSREGDAPAVPDGSAFSTIGEALDAIAAEFPGRLRLSLNGQSFVEGNPFEDIAAFWRAVRFLATTYHDAKTGAVPCPDLGDALRNECTFFLRSSQSETTMGEYASDYETWWGGRRVKLESHIGKGNAKDARSTIRVAWHWDEESRVVVIGYVGQHQRTRAT